MIVNFILVAADKIIARACATLIYFRHGCYFDLFESESLVLILSRPTMSPFACAPR